MHHEPGGPERLRTLLLDLATPGELRILIDDLGWHAVARALPEVATPQELAFTITVHTFASTMEDYMRPLVQRTAARRAGS